MTPGTPITAANHELVKAGDVIAFARDAQGASGFYRKGQEVSVKDTLGHESGPTFQGPYGQDSWLWNGGDAPLFVFVRPAQ